MNFYFISPPYSLYIYFFGQHSIKKYTENGVIIVNHQEKTPIMPPGTLFYAMHSMQLKHTVDGHHCTYF